MHLDVGRNESKATTGERRQRPRTPALTAPVLGPRAHPTGLLALQRLAGNGATRTLVAQRGCSCGATGPACACSPDASLVGHAAAVQRQSTVDEASTKLLSRGSHGPAVRELQGTLNALGATPQLETDGDFGGATETAVRTFQEAHRLAPDAIVGINTRAMLTDELAVHGANFLVPCHTADRPGPDTNNLVDQPNRVAGGPAGNLVGDPGVGAKENVTFLLTGEPISHTEAEAAGGVQEGKGGTVLGDVAAIDAALGRHPNIGTLAIVSHGGADGTVRIGTSNVFLSDLATQLSQRPDGSIDSIVFLGCNIGRDRAGMAALKKQLGAKAVEGTNCHLAASVTDPIAKVTSIDKMPKGFTKAKWGEQVRRNCIGLAQAHQNCLVGLRPRFKTLVEADPEFLADLYFKNQGKMVFRFAQESDTCFDDLQFGKGDAQGCMRVQV